MLSLRLLAVVRTFLLATIALTAAACAAQGGLDPPKLILSWGESGQEPGKLFQPTGIAVARGGTVFVADTGNDRVQAFDAAGGFLFAFGSSGEEPSQFRRPMDLDIDAEGLLYVAELGGDRVQVFTPDGKLVRTIRGEDTAAGHFDGAAGIMVSPTNDIYVADFYNDRVVRFRADGTFLGVLGVPGRVLPGRLHYPTDVEWLEGRVVVADAYNNRIQVFTPEGKALLRWGGVLGSGLPGSGAGSFEVATGVAADSAGRVYVADFKNHRVQVFDGDGSFLGEFGSQGSGPGEFERPTDMDVGPDGRLYVVDFGNDRIQVFAKLEHSGP